MDPDAALEEMRELVKKADDLINKAHTLDDIVDEFSRLVDLVDGLDQWMSRGGFIPKSWAAMRGEG